MFTDTSHFFNTAMNSKKEKKKLRCNYLGEVSTQPTFTCSKLTIEKVEQRVKSV